MPRYFYNGQEVGVEELTQSAEGVGLSLEDFISKVALLDEGFEVKPDEPIKQVSAINVEQPEQPQFDASVMETFVRDSIKEIKSDPEKEKLYDKTRELADLSRRKVDINRNYKLKEDDYPTVVEFDEWGLPKQQDVFLPNGNVVSQPVTKKANVDQVEDMANFIKVAFDKKFNTLLSSEVSSLKDIQEGQEDAFTDKLDQYKDEVFAEFKKQYPSMSKDFFVQLAGNTYSNGAIAQSLNENIAKEEKEQSKQSFLNAKDLDLNYMNSRLDQEYNRNKNSDPRFAQKIDINNKIKANYDELDKLDPSNPEDIDRINELETSNKVLMNDIQKLADIKPSWADEYAREYEEIKEQYGSYAAQSSRLGIMLKSYYKMSDANAASDELATSYMSFENSKYEHERSTEAKENYSKTFETEFNAFQEGNPTLTKRKAYEQFLKAKLYEEQQVEKFGLETMITVDPFLESPLGSSRGFKMAMELRRKLITKGLIDRNHKGKIQASLKDVFDAGYDGRDFDSWFDMKGRVSKEDVEKLLSYESAKYRSKAAVSTTYDLLYLNNDPGSLDRSPGAFRLFAETASKATLTHFSDTSPEEAEKIIAGDKERTRSVILDKFEQHVGEYNNFYSEKIGKGEVEKLEFTKEQIEALEKSFGEEVGEGVGHFVPMLIELGVLTAATGGVLNVTGGARFLHALKNGTAIKNISTGYQKAMYHGMMAMIEEGKMYLADFNFGTGSSFYGVGAATSGIKLKGRFAALDPFFQKVVKAGPVGAVASQTSVVVENAVQDLMDNKDFATEIDAHFKDFTFKDVIVESAVFTIVGAQHLKSRDLMSTNRKINALAEVRLNIDKELKKENPNNDRLNSFRKAEQALNQMVLTETGAIKLDIKSENFEKDYSNVYIKPIEAALRRLDSNYKGIEVKFVEGKEALSEATNDAEFRYKGGKEGKDLIIIDKNAWEPGKSTHENTHALMENYFNRNPELAVRFSTNMAKIFKAANFKTQDGTPLDIAIKKAYELDLRKSKDKVTAAKEYLAYMTEILTNPEVYYREVAPTMFKQMRQEFISIAEENFGYRPKIKNARQFVELMGRFSQDARRGLGIEMKAARLADLQEFDFLGIEFMDAQGKVVVNNLASKNLNQKVNKSLAEKTKLIEANKKLFAEGKKESQEFINNTNKIKEINSSIDKARKNIEISNRNEELFKEYEPVDKLFKETQDPGASIRRSKLFEQIRENNRGILDNYINNTFQTVQGSKVTRQQFSDYVYNTEFNKLLNSYMNRRAELKDVPFGAYLQLPNTLNLRTGNILKALQQGEAVGRETSLDVLLEKGYDPAMSSEAAGISASTSRAYEANGKRLVEEFNVPQTVVEKIMTEAGKVEVEGFTYKNLKDLAPEFANQMVGVEPKKGNISKGSVANAQKWFSDPKNAQLFIDLLPNGAITEGKAGTKDIFGTATGVENVLLKDFYTKGERAETGPGLAVQSKNSNIEVSKVQEFFGINADGTTTYNRNLSSKVKAAVNQIGKAITNQVVRENIKTDPRFDFINKVEEVINRLEAGKSDALATKDILGYYKENNIKGRPLADIISFMKDPESFEKNNPKKFKALKDIIENEAVKEAEIGREAEVQFTKETKKLPYEWAQNGSYQVSQAKFKESAELIKEFQNNSFDVAGIIPLEAAMILGNGKVMVDLFTGHYGAVRGITQMDKVNSPFKTKLRAELTNGKESPLSKELQERWKKFDWEKLTTSYASEFYTGLKDAYKLNTLKEQREAIFKFANSDKGKLQVELYDLWNSTLQEWSMLETPGSQRYNEKMNYIARIKKHNSVIGTTGERILAPAGYYYIPGVSILEKGAVTKDVKKIVKFEHLKSSSEMSYESLALIAEGMWTTKGTQALSKYRGIWGLLKDFDMVDKATGKTNSADIHRMAKSLELAKNIYSVKSGLKETLYSEIVKDVGIKEVNKIVSADKTITKQSIKKLKDAGLYFEGTTNVMASKNLKLHDKALENARKKNKEKKGMSTFDFDETLIDKGKNFIIAREPNTGKQVKISSGKWPIEGPKYAEQGYTFDFKDFVNVRGGVEGPLFKKFKERLAKFGPENMFILTARPPEAATAIYGWLKSKGVEIPFKNITGLGNSTGEAKAMWMVEKFAEGYNDMYFVDDALPNVKAVKKALSQLDVKSDVQQALASKNLNLESNKILESTFGVPALKQFTKAEAKQRGKDKKRRRIFMPDTASDLELLLEPLFGKGKKGIENKKWFDENFVRKYERGINDFNNARQTITNGYLALRKANKDIVKKLPKNVEGTNFTLDQALRVYIWNKNGYNIPDLAKSTQKKLVSHVIKDPKLQAYAEKLAKITKVEGGLKEPSAEWWSETIATEISDLGKGIGREKYLADFIQARKEIFSEANLNKMEAELGSNWRETIEDMFDRMETGRTRSMNLSKGGAAIMNYLNGSVGTIMNFNTRSGVLQLISSVNFINHSFNNPLKATQAFLNQPQYWKDFMYIMNSNMLKQRRAGLQINVTEAELASAVEGKQNKAKAALAHLIKAGYLPTKIADSFAIASGGATYYRNLIKKYMKEGMSKSQAEKQAFIDFQVVAERTQQSSRADLLSKQQTSLEGRLILAFANTPMQMNRIMMKEILDLSKGRYKGSFGDNSFTHKMSRIAYFGAVQSMIFAALQSGLLALVTNEDEKDRDDILVEEKKTMALNTVADSFLRGMGIQGAVLSGIKNAIFEFVKQNEKNFGADYSEVAEDLLNISPTIGSKFSKLDAAGNTYNYNKKLIEAEGLTLNGPLMQATTQTTEALFNVPTNRVYKKLNNINNALTGGYEDWQTLMVLLGWSNWDVGAGTPRVINKGKENEYIRYETAEDIRRREAKEMLRSSKKKRRTTVTFPD